MKLPLQRFWLLTRSNKVDTTQAVVTTSLDTTLGAVVTTPLDTTMEAVATTQVASVRVSKAPAVMMQVDTTQEASVRVSKASVDQTCHRPLARFHRRIWMQERTLFSNMMHGPSIDKGHHHHMVLNAPVDSELIQGEPTTLPPSRRCRDFTVKDAKLQDTR